MDKVLHRSLAQAMVVQASYDPKTLGKATCRTSANKLIERTNFAHHSPEVFKVKFTMSKIEDD